MIESKILSNVNAFAEKYKSIYTGCLHYKNEREETRDVIALVENILYALSQITTYSLEKAEWGFAFLERLFKFFTPKGFPGAIHEFPHVYSDKANLDICLALTFFLKNYSKVVPKVHKLMIEGIKDQLLEILSKRELKPLDRYLFETCCLKSDRKEIEISTFFEYEKVVLCRLLMGEKVVLSWHKTLDVYTGPLLETYYKEGNPLSSLFTELIHGTGESHMSLFAALLPKKGWQKWLFFEEMEREDLYINHRAPFLSIHFEGASFVGQGNFTVTVCDDEVTIALDPFEDMDFYFTCSCNNFILVDGIKATVFYPEERVFLKSEKKTIILRFISQKEGFIGHIMRGNRLNQISKKPILFDHRIHLLGLKKTDLN